MDTQKRLHENLSALVDGELAASEVELAFASLDTPEGRAAWDAYHRIGHALRSERCGSELSDGFSERMAARLGAEALIRHGPAVRNTRASAGTAADNETPAPAAATTVP